MRLDELGELALLTELEERGLAVGIEHDAAEIAGVVVTQDALIERVHFRFDLVTWRDLGFRAAAVNISDLAASGAEPLGLVVSLGVPGSVELADVLELYEGLNEPGVPVRGGDTTRAESVVLSVTALGRSERVPLAAGATIEDLGFGEDYELLAATPDALGFTVIGRCEEGSGVALSLRGEPVELAGWEHFR